MKVQCVIKYGFYIKETIGEALCVFGNNTCKCLQSQCYYDVDIGSDVITIAKALVVNLMLSGFDTPNGISLSADSPFGQNGLMNISRPAVLQIYYGLNVQAISPTIWNRFTYGPTSLTGTLGMDPRFFTTKPMPLDMFQLGRTLKTYVKEQFKIQNKRTDILECEMNHCTVLIYNPHSPNINSNLSYHCDCQYDHYGNFKKTANTQCQNTPVIVYTLGDSRQLFFRKRMIDVGKKSKQCWKNNTEPCEQFQLHHNSIFVLHPVDEVPMIRCVGETKSQYQHGNVKVKDGDLSIGLIFRCVTHTLNYDNITSRRVLPKHYFRGNTNLLQSLDATLGDHQKIENMKSKFTDHVTTKCISWSWIK